MNALLFAITAIAFLVMWTILLRPRADRRCEHCGRPLEVWPEEHNGHRLLVCRHCRKAWGWGVSLRPSLAVCPRCHNQSLQITGTPDADDEHGIHIVEDCHLCGYSHEGALHLRTTRATRQDGNVIFFPGADETGSEVDETPAPTVPDATEEHEGQAIPFPGSAEPDDAEPAPDEPQTGPETPSDDVAEPPEPKKPRPGGAPEQDDEPDGD